MMRVDWNWGEWGFMYRKMHYSTGTYKIIRIGPLRIVIKDITPTAY